MGKGRATATFNVFAHVEDEELVIMARVPYVGEFEAQELNVNGTVALGKAVAELGKVAAPITARSRRVAEFTQELVDNGLDADTATTLAEKAIK